MITFDGAELANAWLAVWAATATGKDAPAAINRTVLIEVYPHAARLWATDQFVLLMALVSDVEDDDPPPTMDQDPDRVVIVCDADGLARHLLGHVLALVRRIDKEVGYQPGAVTVSIDFDARLAPAIDADRAIEGLEPSYAVLSVPDVESVYLEVVDTPAPNWRPIVHAFTGEETKQVSLNPEFVERLGRVRRYAEGPLVWKFGGEDRPAMVDWPSSRPHIEGVVVPRRHVDEAEPNAPDEDGTG